MSSRLLFHDAVQCFATLESTNSYAIDLVKSQNVREGTIIWAIEQTAGRGQQATKWQSAANMSLTFSQILYPTFLEVQKIAFLNMCIALAIQDAVSDFTEEKIWIKWPNDIYVKGKKLGGILIENGVHGNHLSYAVIGVGLNVNQWEFPAELPLAISLLQVNGETLECSQLLAQIQQRIAHYYGLLEDKEYTTIKLLYLHHLLGFHEAVYIESSVFNGKVKVMDITDDGRVVVVSEEEEKFVYGIKEVRWKI